VGLNGFKNIKEQKCTKKNKINKRERNIKIKKEVKREDKK